MAKKSSNLEQKIWALANVLRDNGVSYGDYLEQITYILFLKMYAENAERSAKGREDKWNVTIPDECTWQTISVCSGQALIEAYEKALEILSTQENIIGEIYRNAKNKITKAANLSKVFATIGDFTLGREKDNLGDIYESLMKRIAEDTKSGAGQYFTPRELIKVIVECIDPAMDEDERSTKIADPCCGSGGFLLAAKEHLDKKGYSKSVNEAISKDVFSGNEIVDSTLRTCLMNLVLHGISNFDGKSPISHEDSLANEPKLKVDYVLTNPPFGAKSSIEEQVEKKDKDGNTVLDKDGNPVFIKSKGDQYNRQDFFVKTTNKQANFVQHIISMLKVNGKAAVVLPDDILFKTDNAYAELRKRLFTVCKLHTILRLPSGIFYAHGVKANVLFFDKAPAQVYSDKANVEAKPATKEIWFFDYRTGIKHTLKQNPLKKEHLDDFVQCYKAADRNSAPQTYHADTNPNGRWRKYSIDEILQRDKYSLDITWIKETSEDDDKSLAQIMTDIKHKSQSLAAAVGELERLFADINDA